MKRRQLMTVLAAVLAMAGAADVARAADAPATVTILEGDALVLRGLARLQAAEGLALAVGDIVETSPGGFMQIELDDRAVLQFGPSTRAMLDAGNARKKPERWWYVMNGWVKFSGPGKEAPAAPAGAPRFDLRAPLYELPSAAVTAVLQTAPTAATVFVEQGEVRLVERGDKPVPVAVKGGERYERKAGSRGTVTAGVPASFAAELPRPFRDSLPSRLDRVRDLDVKPKPAPDFGYADVEVWLNAEPEVRKPFVKRWRVKAQDKAFRAALIAGLPQHPEWDPVLFPEKYLPKPKPASAPAPATTPAYGSALPETSPQTPPTTP